MGLNPQVQLDRAALAASCGRPVDRVEKEALCNPCRRYENLGIRGVNDGD